MAAHPCVLARLREAAARGSTVTAIAASRLGVACAFASRSQVPEVVVWVGSEPVAAGAGDLHAVTVVALGDRGGAPVCCFASRSGAASWDLRSDARPVARFEEESARPSAARSTRAAACSPSASGAASSSCAATSRRPSSRASRATGPRRAAAFEAGGGGPRAAARTAPSRSGTSRNAPASTRRPCCARRPCAPSRWSAAASRPRATAAWLFERQEDSGFCAELLVLDLRKSLPATASPAPAAPPAPAVISSEPAARRRTRRRPPRPRHARGRALRFTESGLAVATPSHVLAVDVVSRGVAVVEALHKVASVAALSPDGSRSARAAGAFEAAVYAGTPRRRRASTDGGDGALLLRAAARRLPADSPLAPTPPPPKDRTPPTTRSTRRSASPAWTCPSPSTPRHDYALPTSAALLGVEFSSDARCVVATSSGGAPVALRLPVAKHRGSDAAATALGLGGRPTHASFSHDGKWVVRSGHEGAPPQVFANHRKRAVEAPTLALKAGGAGARFYYLDRFLLAPRTRDGRAELALFAVGLDEGRAGPGDGAARRVHAFGHGDAKRLDAVACLNGAYSPLIVTATSDRRVSVLDAAAGRRARVIDDAHARPAHDVAAPGHPAPGVARSTCDDGAARFTSHANKRDPIRCAFSPCMRFLACGSEDKCAYVYDIRAGRALALLKGARDAVAAVAFNPKYPQLATASYDGKLRFYTCA
ncbi:hypothetical protein JL722_9586 [Aureococcus anophagefferens]|nr:hypothetical protein JL722_9586 [Aureococcus anophagefferens]